MEQIYGVVRLSTTIFVVVSTGLTINAFAQPVDSSQIEENKRIATSFYDDLWFNNRTENYGQYVADTYVAHDIGDRKNSVEPAIEQKQIADFFWDNGTLSGEYVFQVAEGDLVATRWISTFEPETLFGKVFLGKTELPIINVFRIEDGKIVELWNHRHDIDTSQTLMFVAQGLLIGLLIALVPLFWALRLKRQLTVSSVN